MSAFTVEYAVQMKCASCKDAILNELSTIENVRVKDVNVEEQRLVVEFGANSPSVFQIQDLLENKLKRNAVIRGTGDSVSAVTEIHGSQNHSNVIGVVRYVQSANKLCFLDAVIDGLNLQKQYQLGIHEYGDLSDSSYSTIGQQIYSFGFTKTGDSHRLVVKKSSPNCDLASFIGRAFAIHDADTIVGAGIVARTSKIMDNNKKVCACSGKTLWEERRDHKTINL